MNKIYKFYSILALLVLSASTAKAWTFTWNGSNSTNWGTAANWTKTGTNTGGQTTPNSTDDVVINNGALSNQPELNGNLTINTLSLSAGVFYMASYTLTVNSANFTGGTLRQGWIDAKNFTTLQNTFFDAFSGIVVLNKINGGSNNDVSGGNTFSGPCAVANSSTSRFRLAVTNPDNHLGFMHYEEVNTGALEPAYSGVNLYADAISTQGSPNFVSFGAGGGAVVVTGDATMYGGATVFNRLTINTNSVFQLLDSQFVTTLRVIKGVVDLNQHNFRITGSARILGGNFEDGTLMFSDMDTMQGASFTGMNIFKINGGNNIVRGGNTFTDVIIANYDNSSFRMASRIGDDFNGNIQFLEMSSGALEPAAAGNNTFSGSFSTIGSANVVTFGADTGYVTIDGNTTQSISGDFAKSPLINKLKMNTSGSLDIGSANVSIYGLVDFKSGIINSNISFMLIFLDNALARYASNASHVAGPVAKIGNDAFSFPVGDGSFYAKIAISAPSNVNDQFTAQYSNTAYNDLSVASGGGLDHVSSEEWWDLDRTTGTSNVFVTLSHNASQRSGPVNNLSNLRVAHFAAGDWSSMGAVSTTGNVNGGDVTTNSVVSNFSPFTLGSSSALNPLPITLLNFNALPFATKVLVKWSTTNESNNDFFTVEKSLDGRNWISLGDVDGAENSNIIIDYELNDLSPVEGLQYYRLKQTDLNGKQTISGIVPVRYNSNAATDVVIYPQPAANVLNVSLQNNESENANISLFNAMGQKVIEMNNLGGNNFIIDISSLNSGVYYMELNVDGLISKTKVIKQ